MTDKNETIKEALAKLDVSTDLHWTKEGLPALNFVNILSGGKHSREEVEAAFPGFTRTAPNGVAPNAAASDGVTVVTLAPSTPELVAPVVPSAVPVAPSTALKAAVPEGSETTVVDDGNVTALVATPADPERQDEGPADDDAARQRELESRQEHLEELDAEIEKLRQARVDLVSEIDKLIMADPAAGQDSLQEANAGYFAQRKKQLEARGKQQTALREAGITPRMLDAIVPKRAPIDEALGRRPRQRN